LEQRLAQLDIPAVVTESKVDVDLLEDVAEQELLNGTFLNLMSSYNNYKISRPDYLLYSARALAKAIPMLKEAVKDIEILKARVEELEDEAIHAQHDLDTAHHKITTHERIIRQFVGPDQVNFLQEYERDSDDSDDLVEETAPPQTDSSIY
jgi:hypothetical protein